MGLHGPNCFLLVTASGLIRVDYFIAFINFGSSLMLQEAHKQFEGRFGTFPMPPLKLLSIFAPVDLYLDRQLLTDIANALRTIQIR